MIDYIAWAIRLVGFGLGMGGCVLMYQWQLWRWRNEPQVPEEDEAPILNFMDHYRPHLAERRAC